MMRARVYERMIRHKGGVLLVLFFRIEEEVPDDGV
jgi:hypothetical protein